MRRIVLALAAVAMLVGPTASASAHPSQEVVTVEGYAVTRSYYGARHHREFREADLRLADGSRADLYMFTGQAGDYVQLSMRSSEVDSYLLLRSGRPFGDLVASNDDVGRNSRNALVRVVLPRTGTYYITTTTYGSGAHYGHYELRVDSGWGID